MSETARARAWIYTTLMNDPVVLGLVGNRVYHAVAPADAQYPFVIFQLRSGGNDLRGVGMTRIWAEPLYLIKAICKGTSSGSIEPVVNAIDAALHGKSGTVTNGVIVECFRERPFELPTDENGTMYMQLGGEYHFRVQQA